MGIPVVMVSIVTPQGTLQPKVLSIGIRRVVKPSLHASPIAVIALIMSRSGRKREDSDERKCREERLCDSDPHNNSFLAVQLA
jgi:hypothetical protein